MLYYLLYTQYELHEVNFLGVSSAPPLLHPPPQTFLNGRICKLVYCDEKEDEKCNF